MNVTKIVSTKCQIFHLKCTKFNFGWTLLGESIAFPKLSSWICGKGNGKEMEGKRKGKGRGEGGELFFGAFLNFFLRALLVITVTVSGSSPGVHFQSRLDCCNSIWHHRQPVSTTADACSARSSLPLGHHVCVCNTCSLLFVNFASELDLPQ